MKGTWIRYLCGLGVLFFVSCGHAKFNLYNKTGMDLYVVLLKTEQKQTPRYGVMSIDSNKAKIMSLAGASGAKSYILLKADEYIAKFPNFIFGPDRTLWMAPVQELAALRSSISKGELQAGCQAVEIGGKDDVVLIADSAGKIVRDVSSATVKAAKSSGMKPNTTKIGEITLSYTTKAAEAPEITGEGKPYALYNGSSKNLYVMIVRASPYNDFELYKKPSEIKILREGSAFAALPANNFVTFTNFPYGSSTYSNVVWVTAADSAGGQRFHAAALSGMGRKTLADPTVAGFSMGATGQGVILDDSSSDTGLRFSSALGEISAAKQKNPTRLTKGTVGSVMAGASKKS